MFTGGCDFRCPFCHNSSLVLPERLAHDTDEEAVLAFLRKRRGTLDGVAVTGGSRFCTATSPNFLKRCTGLATR